MDWFLDYSIRLLLVGTVIMLIAMIVRHFWRSDSLVSKPFWVGLLVLVLVSPILGILFKEQGLAVVPIPSDMPLPTLLETEQGFSYESGQSAGSEVEWNTASSLSAVLASASLIGILVLGVAHRKMRRLRLRSMPLVDQADRRLFDELVQEMGLANTPELLVSKETPVPFVSGIMSPCLVLPKEFWSTLTDEEKGQLGRHEFAHLQSHDSAFLFVVDVLRHLFWYHPFFHYGSYQYRRSMELVADRRSFRDADEGVRYTQLLVTLAESLPHFHISITPQPSALGHRKLFLERSQSILNSLHRPMPKAAPILAVSLSFCALALGVVSVEMQPPSMGYSASNVSDVDGLVGPLEIVDFDHRYLDGQKVTLFMCEEPDGELVTVGLCRDQGEIPSGVWFYGSFDPRHSEVTIIPEASPEEAYLHELMLDWIRRSFTAEEWERVRQLDPWPLEKGPELYALGILEAWDTMEEMR